MKREKTVQRLVLDAMFAALYVVFAVFLSFKAGNWLEVSWASLPILLCGFLLTPWDALAVALVGSFVEQLIGFGVTATMPLWMLPVVMQGVVASLLFCRWKKRKIGVFATIAVSELLLTALNVGVSYLDACLLDYLAYLSVDIPIRILNCGGRAVLSCVVIPLILPPLQKALSRRGA